MHDTYDNHVHDGRVILALDGKDGDGACSSINECAMRKTTAVVAIRANVDDTLGARLRTSAAPVARAITETPRWDQFMSRHRPISPGSSPRCCPEILEDPFVLTQIGAKVSGYRYQDTRKGKLDVDRLVTREDVVALIRAEAFRCCYCHRPVKIVYEHVRDPEQWTLDRIDNSRGHDRDNVLLCCLTCNLRRRCTHSERFALAKSIQTIKLVDNSVTSVFDRA